MMKTFKRETAWAALLYQASIAVYAMAGPTAEIIAARGVVAGVTALPVFLFAGAAFGMDWAKKQTTLFDSSQASSRHIPPIVNEMEVD